MLGPLTLAVPAAVASLAYLNARTQFGYDFAILSGLYGNAIKTSLLDKRDKINLYYIFENHARSKSTADHPFLVYEGKSWTYKEAYDIVLKYATWMKTVYGIAPKEIVALDFMNSEKFIFVWLAIWSLGAVPAFINYNLTGGPLLHCLKTSTARILFVDEEVKPLFTSEVQESLASTDIRDGKGFIETVFLDAKTERQILETEGVRQPDSSRSGALSKEMAVLIYTSGTTGLPKAAIVSWYKSYFGGVFLGRWMGLKRNDRFYTCMPLYHSTAFLLGFCPVLNIGSTFVIGHKFSNRSFWPEVRASKATVIQYVGETCRYLLAAPPQIDTTTGENLDKSHSVKVAFGNGLRPDVWEKFKDRFGIEGIAEFYGATEATSAAWNFSRNSFSTGAIGRAGTLVTAMLGSRTTVVEVDWETEAPRRDPERQNLCTRVERGDPGELLFALDARDISATFQGYFGNKKATNSKILRDVMVKGDAWFRTGDVIRWDKEGRFFFCDRIGDTFRWKSENISTAEVQEALGSHPAIQDANVYGVELPNHDGRAGCVAVVFNQDVDARLLSSVAEMANQGLPKYAVPLFLRVTNEMQATGNNKQQKHTLRNEGVEPAKAGIKDKLYWLKDSQYVEFRAQDWEDLQGGRVRL